MTTHTSTPAPARTAKPRATVAHRMPEEMLAYGTEAAGRGLRVIVAGAGGAAHLPGMLAAVTPLPVIGVPVPLKQLDGLDIAESRYPVGLRTIALDSLLVLRSERDPTIIARLGPGDSVEVLAASDEGLRQQMTDFQARLKAEAQEKGAVVRRQASGSTRMGF